VNLLKRYIFVQFSKNIMMLIVSFIAIYILIDFFEKIDNFMEKGKSMALVIKFFLLSIPFVLEQMGPVCILLAGVVTLGILNHSNELVALKSCGIPLKKITGPIITAGIAATLLQLAMSQFILPKTVAQTNRIWNKEVKGRVPLGIYRNGRYYYRGDNTFYSFARPDSHKNEFLFFSYASWNPEEYQLETLIAAEQAFWKDGKWTLHRGQIQSAAEDGQFQSEVFRWRNFDFPEKPEDFFIPQYRSKELSLVDLYREALHKKAPEEKMVAWTEFYERISYIMLGLPLLLLGLPILLIVYRKWGRDLSLAVPVSCGMAFACWGIWGTLQSLAKAGYMDSLLAAVSIHLVIGLTGILLLLREDT
jgi:lipopolysaccharide export system permease protein